MSYEANHCSHNNTVGQHWCYWVELGWLFNSTILELIQNLATRKLLHKQEKHQFFLECQKSFMSGKKLTGKNSKFNFFSFIELKKKLFLLEFFLV
jgi:hypothetical protein